MPRRTKDPINDVMDYFESTPLDSAKTALEVAGNIVRRRNGKPAAPVAPKKPAVARAAKPTTAGPGPVTTVGE